MPRTKKAASEAHVPAEPAKRRTAIPQSTAVNHKHTKKKTLAPEVDSPESVASPSVVEQKDIAQLAYSYWTARGCQGGCPQDDWFRAERELNLIA